MWLHRLEPVCRRVIAHALLITLISGFVWLCSSERTSAQTPPNAGTKFNTIQFIIHTDDDDLRWDSLASAQILGVNGQRLQVVQLKAATLCDGIPCGWDNNSWNTVSAHLSSALSANDIGSVEITMYSHPTGAEAYDNWNVREVQINLINTFPNNAFEGFPLVGKIFNPYVRLTHSAPSVTLKVAH